MGQSRTAVLPLVRRWLEAAAQLTRALDQIATLPATPALRRAQIKLQIAVIVYTIGWLKGLLLGKPYAAAEQARPLIEQSETVRRASRRPTAVILRFSMATWTASFRSIQRLR